MGDNLRAFTASLQDPNAQPADGQTTQAPPDPSAQSQADPNAQAPADPNVQAVPVSNAPPPPDPNAQTSASTVTLTGPNAPPDPNANLNKQPPVPELKKLTPEQAAKCQEFLTNNGLAPLLTPGKSGTSIEDYEPGLNNVSTSIDDIVGKLGPLTLLNPVDELRALVVARYQPLAGTAVEAAVKAANSGQGQTAQQGAAAPGGGSPPPGDDSTAEKKKTPFVSPDNSQQLPPAREPQPQYQDPYVGQNRLIDPTQPVDPNKNRGGGLGVTGTWDFNKPPKPTGPYVDLPPNVGPLRPSGDVLPSQQRDPASVAPGPTFEDHPPRPGFKFNRVTGTYEKDPDADPCLVTPPTWKDVAPLCERFLSDHHFKAIKSQGIVDGDTVCDMYLDDHLVELRATTGHGQAEVSAAVVVGVYDAKSFSIDVAHLVAARWDAAVSQALASSGSTK